MKSEFDITLATLKDVAQVAPLYDAYRQFYEQESDLVLASPVIRREIPSVCSEPYAEWILVPHLLRWFRPVGFSLGASGLPTSHLAPHGFL